ncbi:MAG: TIGR00341 family protein, partial [Anaerolineales bacterium]|nr:TIGR00341 family protein [Anaerolineales bacterium]
LLLISFIGLEIGAGLKGDLSNRSVNGPRVLIMAVVLAGLILSFVSLVLLGKGSTTQIPTLMNPIADLAGVSMGRRVQGGITILSLLAIPLALDRILSLLINQGYAMTRDGFWPEVFKKINPRTKKPVFLLLILVILISFTQLVNPGNLARLGSLFYLLVLMAVNFTLTRQKQLNSSFQLPIHPWIPALVLVFDLLLSLVWAEFFLAAGLMLGLGFLFYLLYSRHHRIKAKEGITVFKTPLEEEKSKQHKRILVPIANPETAESLLHLAGSLVKPEGGKVIALRVITVPNQLPLSEGSIEAEANRMLLDQAIDQATKEEFRVQTMTRVSRSIAEGILDTAREEDVDQILVGWAGGETRTITRSLGPVLDPIITDAPCDVLIVKGFNWKDIKTILVPTAGGPNAPIGAKLAAMLSQTTGADVTGLYVQVGRASNSRMAENRRILERTFQDLPFPREPEKKIIDANSPLAGILAESENYDLVIVGASEQGFIDQFAFGSIPQQIASQAPHSSVMVKGFNGAPEFWFKKVLSGIFNLFPTITAEEQLEVREELIDNAQPGKDYFVLIVLSSIIATLGLLLNSPAVVIGAMLVAPLMSPILGFSLGIVLGEVRLVRTSLESVFKGVMATIIVSILVGLISPLKEMTPEILARTQPTLLDLFIALASGMAGAYALSRKEVSAALPGVAIAAALAPPLSVVGLGLANGNMQAAGGALLLFVTNLITISLAGVMIFTLLGIHPLNLQPEIKKRVRRGITGMVLLVVIITFPLGIIMNGIIQQNRQDLTIQRVLDASPLLEELTELNIDRSQSRNQIVISATVRSPEPLSQAEVNELARALEEELQRPLILNVILLPIITSE